MCNFKSGIILRDRVAVAQGEDDSHERLLESLGIEDSYIGASKTFVRAELVPHKNEWWISPLEHPELWDFVVDQDILPEWFDASREELAFRRAVCSWWMEHVFLDKKIDVLAGGYYRLRRCEVGNLCNDVKVSLYDSTVGTMRDSSQVDMMCGSATVAKMCDSSMVETMRDSSMTRNFKDYHRIKIIVPDSERFEVEVFTAPKS